MKTMNGWMILAIILVFIGNIGGVLIIIIKSNNAVKNKDLIIKISNENNEKLKNDLLEMKNESKIMKISLEKRDIEIKKLSKKSIELSEEMSRKSEEFNTFMGFSEAYPFVLVNPSYQEDSSKGFTFIIKNEFEHAIYDILINIIDFNKLTEYSTDKNGKYRLSQDDFKKCLINVEEITHLGGKSDVFMPDLYYFNDTVLYLKIKSRANLLIQRIAIVKFNDIIYTGFQIKNLKGEILKEWFSDRSSNTVKEIIKKKFELIPDEVAIQIIH